MVYFVANAAGKQECPHCYLGPWRVDILIMMILLRLLERRMVQKKMLLK